MAPMAAIRRPIVLVAAILLAAASSQLVNLVSCQLPDDIQRELNQNLAEQARIQALQQQQQQRARSPHSRASQEGSPSQAASPKQQHDPNNYSYQQVSPPIQYSYYQPFGDAAAQPGGAPAEQPARPQQTNRRQSAGSTAPLNFDLNNMNFELPQPQAQVAAPLGQQQQQHYTPSFTGVGGLPVMRPIAAAPTAAAVPLGAAPLPAQARVQQGPPLTEADFRDITGGENYGAPGGNDFGLGDAASSGRQQSRSSPADSTDAQLREFGLPAEPQQQQQPAAQNRRLDQGFGGAGGMSIPDFGGFNPIGVGSGQQQQQQQQQAQQPRADSNNDFADFANMGGSPADQQTGSGDPSSGGGGGGAGNEFTDFAVQPSSRQPGGGAGVDQAASTLNGGAPGSLQSLLGAGFPGLGGGGANSAGGLDEFARANNNPQSGQQRNDDGALDVADLGEKADGFSGADLGGFEQPNPRNDRDFNYEAAAAASNQQPKSVPYPDGNPQPVGTLWALTQPQSLSQTRYSALPDKGTYQDYPAYADGGNDFGAVGSVVDETPRARPPAPGRYGEPSPQALAPEVRQSLQAGQQYNYGREPASAWQQQAGGSDRAGEFDFPFE